MHIAAETDILERTECVDETVCENEVVWTMMSFHRQAVKQANNCI